LALGGLAPCCPRGSTRSAVCCGAAIGLLASERGPQLVQLQPLCDVLSANSELIEQTALVWAPTRQYIKLSLMRHHKNL
jgi:hypothetical protein